MGEGKRERERERKSALTWERKRERKRFGSSFYMFSLPLGLPCANWAQPGVLSVLPEVFTLVLGPSFLATAILDSFFLFYLPNRLKVGKRAKCLVLLTHSEVSGSRYSKKITPHSVECLGQGG